MLNLNYKRQRCTVQLICHCFVKILEVVKESKISVLSATIKSKSRKVNKLRISSVSSGTCSFIMHAASVKPKLSISAADSAKPPLAPGKAFFKS